MEDEAEEEVTSGGSFLFRSITQWAQKSKLLALRARPYSSTDGRSARMTLLHDYNLQSFV